jgi:hypothetical protein
MVGVMRRSWLGLALAALMCVAVAACTTTDSKRAEFAKPQTINPGAKVLVIKPDVELVMLLASGLEEPKADWSKAGADNLVAGIDAQLTQRGHSRAGAVVDPATMTEGRVGQLLRLHDAVAQSILVFHHGGGRILPTKRNSYDWTIGEGARELAAATGADYALFTLARGSYASGGRTAMAVVGVLGMFAGVGVNVPMGGQQVLTLLVDLKTGQVLWSQVASAGPGVDMREAQGAQTLIASILKEAPL